jgi:hypothetical protein
VYVSWFALKVSARGRVVTVAAVGSVAADAAADSQAGKKNKKKKHVSIRK